VTRNLNSDRNFNTITLEVEAQAALQIALIRDTGARLGVLLRNNDDTERLSVPGTTLTDVLGADAAKIIRAPAAGPR
jgi:Flp pilus assembly protein CpaB